MDDLLFLQLRSFVGQSALSDTLIIFFASRFQYVVGAVLLFWLVSGKTPEEKKNNRLLVLGAFLSAVISRLVLTEIVRFYYFRPRPFVSHSFLPLIAHGLDPSFPSGHAAFFFGMAFFVWMMRPKLSPFFFVSAVLISLARVAAGIHYPGDILGGAVIGFLAAWITERAWQYIFFRRNPVPQNS